MRPVFHVNDFHCVVAECRDEQSVPRRIEREMIQAALNSRELDCADERNRLL